MKDRRGKCISCDIFFACPEQEPSLLCSQILELREIFLNSWYEKPLKKNITLDEALKIKTEKDKTCGEK